MTKTYLALGFFIIYKLLAVDAYGNTQLKSSFGQKNQTSHNIGAYKNGKKIAQVFRPSAKNKKERSQWTQNKTKNNWSIMLGGLGAVKPKYKGSSQYEVSGYPFIDIKYKKGSDDDINGLAIVFLSTIIIQQYLLLVKNMKPSYVKKGNRTLLKK